MERLLKLVCLLITLFLIGTMAYTASASSVTVEEADDGVIVETSRVRYHLANGGFAKELWVDHNGDGVYDENIGFADTSGRVNYFGFGSWYVVTNDNPDPDGTHAVYQGSVFGSDYSYNIKENKADKVVIEFSSNFKGLNAKTMWEIYPNGDAKVTPWTENSLKNTYFLGFTWWVTPNQNDIVGMRLSPDNELTSTVTFTGISEIANPFNLNYVQRTSTDFSDISYSHPYQYYKDNLNKYTLLLVEPKASTEQDWEWTESSQANDAIFGGRQDNRDPSWTLAKKVGLVDWGWYYDWSSEDGTASSPCEYPTTDAVNQDKKFSFYMHWMWSDTTESERYEVAGEIAEALANNPPVANAGGPYEANEGSPISFNASASSDPDGDSLNYEWDFDNNGVIDVSSSEPTTTYTWNDDYTDTVSLKVTDEEGLSATASTTVTVNNVAPTVTVTGDVISENGIATVSGTINDPSSTDNFEVEINWGDGNIETFSNPADSTEFSETHQYMDDDPSGTSSDDYTVIVTVTDDDMGEEIASTTITVNNIAPVVGAINSPVDPIKTGEEISVDSTFIDAGTLDTHTAVWDWDNSLVSDGIVTETDGSGAVNGTHTYSSAGVYKVNLTVTDDDAGSNYSVSNYIVIYDPEGGFVTGGGWINSPEKAYVPDPTLTGTANFGFVSKYKKGATVPTGVTQFNFQVADLNFHSDTYDWLVIAGARAQYKGTGTINGEGEYGFMLTAIDGQLNGGGGSDKFRIKIWDKDSEAIVYDNMLDAEDDADPKTVIQGGSITIHKE